MSLSAIPCHPYIVEDEQIKSLQFSAWGVQSRMNKNTPNDLVLSYTQAMMAFLLLRPEPKDIVIVGLGGGSLSKYCYHRMPHSRITTIEINADVIALRKEFFIPDDDARFRVVHGDAAQYLANQEDIADVILLDGYDNTGIPAALTSLIFYRHCRRALRDDGLLVANISSSVGSSTAYINRIHTAFQGKTAKICSRAGYNDIVFGMKCDSVPDMQYLRKHAALLWQGTGINFPDFLDQLIDTAGQWGRGHMSQLPWRNEQQA